jgi:hypothetical protein
MRNTRLDMPALSIRCKPASYIAEQQPVDLYLSQAERMGWASSPNARLPTPPGSANPPEGSYSYPYYERLQKLQYPFLQQDDAIGGGAALDAGAPACHTAIVGTKNPQRWSQNAQLLQAGPCRKRSRAIRTRWQEVAGDDWIRTKLNISEQDAAAVGSRGTPVACPCQADAWTSKMMKAIQVHEAGGPEVLLWEGRSRSGAGSG